MSVQAEKAPSTTTTLDPATVNVRVTISALWTAMLFVFVYVDLFSLYRPDVRADIEAGQLGGFTVDQTFLLVTTAYIAVPALMVVATLVLRPRISRVANIALSILYALTIVGTSIGEDNAYYLLGSTLEVVLLAAVASYAWRWPRLPASRPVDSSAVRADHLQHSAL